MREPKILLLDIETAPAVVYSWGLFQQDHGINQIKKDGYMLCWCAKWLGEKSIMSDSLFNHTETFTRDSSDDSKITKTIHSLVDSADIIVTHNGRSFDLKWLNTCFIKHGFSPIQLYKTVDTFVEAKKNFYFISNKLDFICQKLDLGKKISTGGFELWEECIRGVKSSWKRMVDYCKNDVVLLERLYLKIRPFMVTHPNVNFYKLRPEGCPNCGCEEFINKGFHYFSKGAKRKLQCKSCHKNYYGKLEARKD